MNIIKFTTMDQWQWKQPRLKNGCMSLQMKINSEAIDGLNELKGHGFDLTDARESHTYDDAVKKIGECVGRVYGKEMKTLVISSVKMSYTKPACPSGDEWNDEKKAIWNKEYDLHMKKDQHEDWKAKVFVAVHGQCTKLHWEAWPLRRH